jgi:hypothetical protein
LLTTGYGFELAESQSRRQFIVNSADYLLIDLSNYRGAVAPTKKLPTLWWAVSPLWRAHKEEKTKTLLTLMPRPVVHQATMPHKDCAANPRY